MKHELCGQHLIDGRWQAAGGETFDGGESRDRRNACAEVRRGDAGEVDAALSAAREGVSGGARTRSALAGGAAGGDRVAD